MALCGALAVGSLVGCATGAGASAEKGPHGTVAYNVSVEASDSGVRIEVNDDYVGDAPITIKIFGDKDGTFHDFGRREFVVRAIPSGSGQFPQTKVFQTGQWFSQEDMIPKRIFFDMKQQGFSLAPK
jgi:hypothetical protein